MPENIAIPAPLSAGQDVTAAAPDTAAVQSTAPGDGECLRCYLLRMLAVHGCDGTHRWTNQWRRARAPRAAGLMRKLARRGGCCCDCEVVLNVWQDYGENEENQPCAGVPAGVIEPCRAA